MGSATFNYTGGWQKFAVPNNVGLIKVTVYGAGSITGKGGRVIGNLSVKDTDVLYLVVGGQGRGNSGRSGGSGGWGGGGDGGDGYNASGGDGGGGYSAIRMNGTGGTVKCVAAGAGGDSGDGGRGGDGGTTTGMNGADGSAGGGATGHASGGTQTQGGNGGSSSSGGQFAGHNASDGVLGGAGNGGSTGGYDGPGGGGGGAGYRSGGGGQGGSTGWAPGGGGAGGSNYTGGITSTSSTRGVKTGNGQIVLQWSDPAPKNSRPSNPSVTSPAAGSHLKASRVTIKATVNDPNTGDKVRIRADLSTRSDFRSVYRSERSDFVARTKTASVTITGLPNATHFYVRVYAEDDGGARSLGYSTTSFYTNLPPLAPTLHSPADGAQFDGLSTTNFTWTANDPDTEGQAAAQVQFRIDVANSAWTTRDIPGAQSLRTEAPGTFHGNTFYIWRARTKDAGGLWGEWSATRRFYVTGVSTPPQPAFPSKGEAVYSDRASTFTWRFRDPDHGDYQTKADLRYRKVGQRDSQWVTKFGNTTRPGTDHEWTFAAGTWGDGTDGDEWEWQVRTYDHLSGGIIPSDWSTSATFHVAHEVSSKAFAPIVPTEAFDGQLGVGTNEAWLAVRGGRVLLGKLGPMSSIQWTRNRDDLSKCNLTVAVPGCDKITSGLLEDVRSWQHEIVVFRDNGFGKRERVWEGPVTRVEWRTDAVEIEATDVMAWVYRRILKQGFNDAYPNNVSAVERAERIIVNALARGDYGILSYLTTFNFDDDAKSSRVRPDYSTTAWEEVDDLAAKGGIDYTTVGRRIIIWDTHRPIGRLPALGSGDFSADPVVSEYGMNYCTEYAVTNGAGLYGRATFDSKYTGNVELLVSAYGDVAAASDKTATAAARQKLVDSLTSQAERGAGDRYPAPLVVRVPDNSSVEPSCPIPINYWVPGVWLPLTAQKVARKFTQWQKLDSITVLQTGDAAEQMTVVMSPAPHGGQDPDAEEAAEAASG